MTESIRRWVSARRVQQGFEYLLEMDMHPTRDSLRQYTGWLIRDVLSEEACEIAELKRKFGATDQMIKVKISYAARETYLTEMRKAGVDLPWAAWIDGTRTRSVLETDFS